MDRAIPPGQNSPVVGCRTRRRSSGGPNTQGWCEKVVGASVGVYVSLAGSSHRYTRLLIEIAESLWPTSFLHPDRSVLPSLELSGGLASTSAGRLKSKCPFRVATDHSWKRLRSSLGSTRRHTLGRTCRLRRKPCGCGKDTGEWRNMHERLFPWKRQRMGSRGCINES